MALKIFPLRRGSLRRDAALDRGAQHHPRNSRRALSYDQIAFTG